MLSIGLDVGTSAVKGALMDLEKGRFLGKATYPPEEFTIEVPQPGWAEQDPEQWWKAVQIVIRELVEVAGPRSKAIGALGIAYQMHGLVLMGKNDQVLRPAILWCDSRASALGEKAFQDLGKRRCLERLYNSPGNFTAAKIKWVADNEAQIFKATEKFLLPGDYIAWCLTGKIQTTVSGLSEAMLWDFKSHDKAEFLAEHWRFPKSLFPTVVPTFGSQGTLQPQTARDLGLPETVQVTYRAGDQPNNAFALNALEPGECAASAGTSGVLYGITENGKGDPQSRVNLFAHVNYRQDKPRLGGLFCLNGCGASYSWLKKIVGLSYHGMNQAAQEVPAGSGGLRFFPFGNGAERMLANRNPGGSWTGLQFLSQGRGHAVRAVLEGIACAFRYGAGILEGSGLDLSLIKAGRAGLFQSRLFTGILASITGTPIALFHTDGAQGAARGAGLGAGFFKNHQQAFSSLEQIEVVDPEVGEQKIYASVYEDWQRELKIMNQ